MTTPNLAPESHHPDGPSSWPAVLACACFEGVKDIEDADVESLMPESERPTDTSAKGRGTAQHEALAKTITAQPEPFAGLSESESDQVRWVATRATELAAAAGYSAAEIQVEQRLTMFKPDSWDVLYFGTADIDFGPFILDAKFGDPRDYFAQMCGYALAKMERDGYRRIYAHMLYGRWKKTVTHVIDREVAERVAYHVLNRKHNPHKKPTACEYCHWCKHIAYCEAVNDKVNVLLAKRPDWAMQLPTMSSTEAGPDPVLMGAMRWLWKCYVEPWGKAVEYQTGLMVDSGNIPLGFKKQDQKGDLDLGEDGGKVIAALVAAGIDLEHVQRAASFSQKALAAAFMAQHGGSEAKAKAKVEEILTKAGVASRGDASYKLIRLGDAEDQIRMALARPVTPLPLQ